jgi:hypothetical protein
MTGASMPSSRHSGVWSMVDSLSGCDGRELRIDRDRGAILVDDP